MDNQFPRMLYQFPGDVELNAGRFSTRIVNDQAEQDEALAQGWHLSSGEAKEADSKANTQQSGNQDDDNAPPTRAELEEKAKELGIQFAPNIGDKKLLERINEALAQG